MANSCKSFRIGIIPIFVFFLLVMGNSLSMNAQVTRGQLLKMFYKAAMYHNAGNDNMAIKTYEEIATLAPKLPDTYLRIAEVYETSGDTQSAIVMYRKYINLEMDDEKIKEPGKRLAALENQLGIAHYQEEEEKQALTLFGQHGIVAKEETPNATAQQKADGQSENTQETESTTQPQKHTPLINANGQTVSSIFNLSALVNTQSSEETTDEENLLNGTESKEGTSTTLADSNLASTSQPASTEKSDTALNNTSESAEEEIKVDEAFILEAKKTPLLVSLSTDSLTSTALALPHTVKASDGCEQPFFFYPEKDRLKQYGIQMSQTLGHKPQKINPEELNSILSGKWISSHCDADGRETWIFSFAPVGNSWDVTLKDESGIFLDKKQNVLDASWNTIKSIWSSGRSLETSMQNLKDRTVNSKISNGTLTFKFVSEKRHKPSKTAYSWGKSILEGISSFIPFGSIVNKAGASVIDYISEKDEVKTYSTTVTFVVRGVTPKVLQCEYTIGEKQAGSDGEKQIKEETHSCYFYKAYDSYDFFNYAYTGEKEMIYKKLFSLIRSDSKDDSNKLFPLAYMAYYGAGTPLSTSKAINMMQQLAEENNCAKAKAWLVPVCYNLSLDEERYPLRLQRKQFRKYADKLLSELIMADYAFGYSLQADIYLSSESNLNNVAPLYQRAAEKGDAYAQYKLGNLYMDGQIEERDMEKAMKYLKESAQNGYAEACLQLARIYKTGIGTERDYDCYVRYLYQAINLGSTDAINELGEAYYWGLGVEQSFKEANRMKYLYQQTTHEVWKEVLNIYGYNTIL